MVLVTSWKNHLLWLQPSFMEALPFMEVTHHPQPSRVLIPQKCGYCAGLTPLPPKCLFYLCLYHYSIRTNTTYSSWKIKGAFRQEKQTSCHILEQHNAGSPSDHQGLGYAALLAILGIWIEWTLGSMIDWTKWVVTKEGTHSLLIFLTTKLNIGLICFQSNFLIITAILGSVHV